MAQFFAPRDPRQDKYGQIGELMGAALGGLGGYAINEYQKPAKIKKYEDSKLFNHEEAVMVANMPPQAQAQIVNQKMKMQREQETNAMFGNLISGLSGSPANEQSSTGIPGGDIRQRLGSLSSPFLSPMQQPAQQPSEPMYNPEQEKQISQMAKKMSPEQIDQIIKSGRLNPNQINQFKAILDRERAQEFKERAHGENQELKRESQQQKEEAPQRTQMVKEVAELEKAGRSAKNLISGFKNLKVAARDPKLRTGIWKQTLDRFNMGELGQSPISFVVDKMIQDINFASASSTTTPGKMTSSLLKNIARANPSVFSEPEGIEAMADLKIYGAKIQEEVQKQIDKIRDKSPRGLLPLDTVSKAYKAAMPKIEKLHEKEFEVVKRLSESPKTEIKVGSVVSELPSGKRGKAIDELTGKIIEF